MADQDKAIIDTIIAEALGEGPEGMRWVGETILNRGAIRNQSPYQVVTAPNQYTGYSNPGPAAVRAMGDPNVRSAAEAAWALAQQSGDPTGGADHYHANYVNPYWANAYPQTGTQGNHIFYASTAVPQTRLNALQGGNSPSPQTQSNSLQRQRDLIPSTSGGGSPALQQAMAMLASSSNNPYPQTQSGDLQLMRNPMMSQSAAQQQVTPYPANQSDSMLLRRNPNVGTTIATIPTTGIGQPPRQQTVQGIPFNQNGNAYNEAARRAALLANQSYVGQEAGGGTGYQTALERAKRLAALSANQTYVGQQEAGIRNARLQPGSPYQNYSIAANGPPGLTRQQYEALNSTGQIPLNNAPTPLTASTRLQTLRNGGAVAPIPLMASSGLQQIRNGAPMMGAAAQGVAPVGTSPLRVVVNGAGSYAGQPQQQVAQPMNTGLTPVQTLQQNGLTNAQAYDLLNSINRGSLGVGDRITGAGTQASSGASANSIYG